MLTGTDSITPSNCFQLAATLDDALAEPPIAIVIDPTPVELFTDQVGLGPFVVVPQLSANSADLPISMKEGAVASPDLSACTANVGDMTGKIGINIRLGCDSTVYPNNMANAGAVATITGFTPESAFAATGALVYGVTLDVDDTNALISAINSNPSLLLTIDTEPSATGLQTFDNTTQANSVTTTPPQLQQGTNFICSSTDLNTLGWQPGDSIVYNNNGNANLSPLVSGTTYYAIVYIPGFSSNGFIQDNEVDNCSISCYQDDAGTTSSAWVNNTAFNCGAVPTQFTNYDISFAGVRPVDAGTLVTYPVGGNKYYNLSLVP